MDGLLRFATGHLISSLVLILLVFVLLLILFVLLLILLVVHNSFLHFICTADAPHVYCAPNSRIYPWL